MLVLKALKAREAPTALIYDDDAELSGTRFNRLIRLMNAVNVELTRADDPPGADGQGRLKHAWLQTLRFWADDVGSLRVLTSINMKEPITASEYAKRQAEAREELLPLAECAQIVAEDHSWVETDYLTDKEGEREVSDKAWNRVYRATRKEMEQLIADGTLPSRRRGRGIVISAGAFYDWRGEPTPVYPEDAWESDVRPDDQAEQVEQDRRAQAAVRRILDRAPKPLSKPTDLRERSNRRRAAALAIGWSTPSWSRSATLVRQHWCEARSMGAWRRRDRGGVRRRGPAEAGHARDPRWLS